MFGFFKPRPVATATAPAVSVSDKASPRGDAVVDAVLMSGVVLPPYPALLEELDQLMAHDDFELDRLVDVVVRDPSLTAALLRVANSPVFGLHQTLTSLRQAVTVLGLARTRAVLRSEVLRDVLRDYGNPAMIQALWQRFGDIGGLTAALAARSAILKHQSDLAYSVGIFHGTGCFILVKRFPQETRGLATAGKAFETQMCQLDEQLGADHAAIGALVARGWRLPPEVVEAIPQQRRLRQTPETMGTASPLACLLRLAVLLHDGNIEPESWPKLRDIASDQIGLDEADLNETMTELGLAETPSFPGRAE
ncbi:MAG: HDOD domain-containing protein [Pseudomonadota bacterium]|nr:HDOD domain-containing protein [Pseudomonadota bacterium]MDP1905367.1 HDOD domain-containing protein [Pseudomonadota bacterium]MDP2354177.1 HDOD domain-containing protein [Pseudomonadota bacterium]